jgi:hypothetical protein
MARGIYVPALERSGVVGWKVHQENPRVDFGSFAVDPSTLYSPIPLLNSNQCENRFKTWSRADIFYMLNRTPWAGDSAYYVCKLRVESTTRIRIITSNGLADVTQISHSFDIEHVEAK